MQPPDFDPPRWSDSTATDPDDAVGRAFRREPPPSINDAALARIGRAVFAGPSPRAHRWPAVRTLVLAALVLVASGGMVGAAWQVWRTPERQPQTVTVTAHSRATISGRHRRRLTIAGPATLTIDPAPVARGTPRQDFTLEGGQLTIESGGEPISVRAGPYIVGVPAEASGEIRAAGDGQPTIKATAGAVTVARSGERPTTVSAEVSVPTMIAPPPATASSTAPSPLPAETPPPSARPRPPLAMAPAPASLALADSPSPPGGLAPAPVESPVATPTEAALLATAFRKLRTDRDPAAALAALDEHDRAFPGGWLRDESALARAEALLVLGRPRDALPLLAAAGALTRNGRVTRGELWAQASQCGNAIGDFDGVLGSGRPDDDLAERALAGRAACLARSGRSADARRDLQRYLALFPRGAHAAEFRHWLEAAP